MSELILGWIFTLILLGIVVKALTAIVAPLLPFIGLGALVAIGMTIALKSRNEWW